MARRESSTSVAAIASDPDALERFYRDHVEAVQRFVARRVDDPYLAADLTADELVQLCHRVLTFWRGTASRTLTGPDLTEEAVLASVNGEDRRLPTGGDRTTGT